MLEILKKIPNPVAYALSVFLEKAFSFITVPLMVSHLAPTDYGRLDQALSLCELIAGIMSFGAADTLIRFASAARTDDDKRRTAADLLGGALILVAVFGVLIQFAAAPLASFWKTSFDLTALRFGLAAVSVACLIEMPLMWIRFNQKAHLFMAVIIGRTVFQVAGTWLMLTLNYGGEGVLISNSIVILTSAAILAALQIRWVGVTLSSRSFRQILVYGLPLVGAGLAMFTLGNLNRWFLAGQVSYEEIGQLGLATRLSFLTSLMLQPFILWWGPRRLADLHEDQGLVRNAENWSLGYSILITSSVAIALAGPLFIHWFLPATYAHASIYLPFMVLVQLLNILSWLCSTGAFARVNGGAVLFIDVTSAIFAFAAFWLLVPKFGVAGAIAGVLIGHGIRVTLYLWAGAQTARIPYPTAAAVGLLAFSATLVALAPSQEFPVARTAWSAAAVLLIMSFIYQSALFRPPTHLVTAALKWCRLDRKQA